MPIGRRVLPPVPVPRRVFLPVTILRRVTPPGASTRRVLPPMSPRAAPGRASPPRPVHGGTGAPPIMSALSRRDQSQGDPIFADICSCASSIRLRLKRVPAPSTAVLSGSKGSPSQPLTQAPPAPSAWRGVYVSAAASFCFSFVTVCSERRPTATAIGYVRLRRSLTAARYLHPRQNEPPHHPSATPASRRTSSKPSPWRGPAALSMQDQTRSPLPPALRTKDVRRRPFRRESCQVPACQSCVESSTFTRGRRLRQTPASNQVIRQSLKESGQLNLTASSLPYAFVLCLMCLCHMLTAIVTLSYAFVPQAWICFKLKFLPTFIKLKAGAF